MNIRWIDFDRVEVYEAGALLVTLLAYPEEGEETRSEVHASLCAHALRVKCAIEPDWALPSQPIKPIYALRRQDENDRFFAHPGTPGTRSPGSRAHGDRVSQRGADR